MTGLQPPAPHGHVVPQGPQFTAPASKRLADTVEDYRRELHARAQLVAKASTAPDDQVEVTAEHVRGAARAIAATSANRAPSGWVIAGQVVEYICAIGVGAASGHLDKPNGIWTFAGLAAVGLLLLAARISRRNGGNA